MIRLIAVLFVLFVSPAYAANEFQGQPFSDVAEMGKKHGVVVEKLNAADTAAMDERVPNRPMPSTIYLLTLGHSVVIALVHDGVVIFSTDPVELEKINKVLNRSGA